ncbi:MAG: hypothetical protein AB7O04_01975 [Hyphomonadaceae bacterium]
MLGAEGFSVSIRHERPEKESESPDAKLCDVVIWSQESVGSWPVYEQAEAAHNARRLVQVALQPGLSPLKLAAQSPIDFSQWQGQRSSEWRMMRDRIDRVARGDDPAAAPFGAVAAMGAASLAILALAVSNRVDDGLPALDPTGADNQLASADLSGVTGAAGGPILMEEILVEDVRPVRPLRNTRRLTLASLPPLPDLEEPPSFRSADISQPGFLRRMLNVAEELPFVANEGAQPPG